MRPNDQRVLRIRIESPGGQIFQCQVSAQTRIRELAADFCADRGWPPHDVERAVVELVNPQDRDDTKRLNGEDSLDQADIRDGDTLRILQGFRISHGRNVCRVVVRGVDGGQFQAEIPIHTPLKELAADFLADRGRSLQDGQRAVVELFQSHERDDTQRLNPEANLDQVGLRDGDILRIFSESISGGADSRPEVLFDLEPRGRLRDDHAFSSQTIVTSYPYPIAIAYRRFLAEREPVGRLQKLFATTEALLRYLVTLGVSDLFHCLARDGAALPDHQSFEFLRTPKPMLLGMWLGALRETARALRPRENRFIQELPVVCSAEGELCQHLMAELVTSRNDCIHPSAYLTKTPDECRRLLERCRPWLEKALRMIGFVCRYPLGFSQPTYSYDDRPGSRRHYVHSCMGVRIDQTVEASVVELPSALRVDLPFVVAPDSSKLLFLWPLLQQRTAPPTARHTLYVFEKIADSRWPCLAMIDSAALDTNDPWQLTLCDRPAASHDWLLQELRTLPAAPEIPREIQMAHKLQPVRGGQLAGRQLGSNHLLGAIGSGGFATVYLAKTPAAGYVAVKVLESQVNRELFRRFQEEFHRLQQVQQAQQGQQPLGIVRCYEISSDVVNDREFPWYSMEYAAGGDLAARIETRRQESAPGIPWDRPPFRREIAGEFSNIAEAVALLHHLGIVHRDIKPGNVLIAHDGELKLSDFGLVKILRPSELLSCGHPVSSVGTVLGTPLYMAPEQELGRDVQPSADVYSLGILLAELATGSRPVPNARVQNGSTLQSFLSIRSLPKGLKKLIERCTDVEPVRRPADAGKLLQQFQVLRPQLALDANDPTAEPAT